MSLFTRKERNQNLSKGKIFKYLTYATGEVLLIVIGVLLAVKINSALTEKKNKAMVDSAYLQIFNDLREDIRKADGLMHYYSVKDSLIYEVMHNQINREDYLGENSLSLMAIAISYNVLNIQDQGFNNLMAINSQVALNSDSLLSQIKQLYFDRKYHVELTNSYMENLINKNIDWLKYNTNWLSQIYHLDRKPSEEQIKFYLENNIYRNVLAEYSQTGPGNHFRSVLSFRNFAHEMYQSLGTYLNMKDISLYDSDEYAHFLGKYRMNGEDVQITLHDNQLFLEGQNGSEKFIPLNKYTFTTNNGGFYHLTETGLEFRYGYRMIKIDKTDR